MKHLLITTDFSKQAARAFPVALAQAEQLGKDCVHINLVHIIESPIQLYASEFGLGKIDVEAVTEEMAKTATAEIEKVAKEFPGIAVSTFVIKTHKPVAAEIVDFAVNHRIDLIVMTTHGYSGFQHFLLGSVAEKVVRSSPCPVLLVPAKEG